MVFKDDLEKIVQENVNKEMHFSYQQKMALIDDLFTELGEYLTQKQKEVLEKLGRAYDDLISLSDTFVFSYTYDYLNKVWRELILNHSEECFDDV